jgi:amino acid transporter
MILGFDHRLIGLLILFLYLIFSLIALYRSGKWPDLRDRFDSLIAMLSVYGGIAILCVFDLTKPPDIDKLSEESKLTIGLVCFVVLAIIWFAQIWSVFSKYRAPASPPPSAKP